MEIKPNDRNHYFVIKLKHNCSADLISPYMKKTQEI